MIRLSRPQTAKKRKKKPEDARRCPRARSPLLLERCKTDVASDARLLQCPATAAPRAGGTSAAPARREINARGICANVPFLEAVRTLAVQERNAVNTRLNELDRRVITSVDQVTRIMDSINAHGHAMSTVNKRSVSAILAHQPDGFVRELLELRQRGALPACGWPSGSWPFANPDDGRIRGALRIYGAGPGRWSSPGAQLHNLRRNDAEYPAHLVNALVAGNHAELARFGTPLSVAAELSRAALRAKPGHVLVCVDLSAIESRITAWLANETWKLEHFQRFDETGDKQLDLYRVLAHRMLHKDTPVGEIPSAERQLGKYAELACGFGGSVGAWRRIVRRRPPQRCRSPSHHQAMA